MTSILKVDNLQDSSGTGTPYIKGAVLQTVVHQEDGATSFSSSASTADELLLASNAADSTSHLSLSITPKSVNSKILLTASVFFEGTSTSFQVYTWSLYRDSTKLCAPAAGSRTRCIAGTAAGYHTADAASTADSANFNYYDSPNTTSAITYAVSFNSTSGADTIYLNRTKNDADTASYERGVSILIAQEIGG